MAKKAPVVNVDIEDEQIADGQVDDQENEDLDTDDLFNEMWGTSPEEDDESEDDDEPGTPEDKAKPPIPPIPSKPVDPYAWIQALPEEVREQANALKHTALSDQGRVAAYNRELNKVRGELDAINKSRTPQASQPLAQAAVPAATKLPDKFLQLKEDFPEFAEAVDSIREHDREAYNRQLQEALTPFQQARNVDLRRQFDDAVSGGALKIFNTTETNVDWHDIVSGEDFHAWLGMQPKSVQNAARDPDPKEALYVLSKYETDYQAAVKLMHQSADALSAGEQARHAEEVKSRRTARQTRAVSPGSRPVSADASGDSVDTEALFNMMWGPKKS